MQSLFTIDGDAIQAAFKFDESALTSGLSGMSLDLSGLSLDMGSLPAFDGSSIAIDPSSIDMSNLVDFSDIKLDLGDVQPTMDSAKMQAAMEDIMAGFNPWYANWAQEQVAQGKVPTMEDGAKAYLESEEVQKKIADAIMGSIDMKQATEALQTQLQQQLSAKMQQAVPAMAQALESQLQASITTAMQQSMNQIAANMSNAMSIDESAFANAFQMNMDENDLTELMMSMMGKEDASYDNNLKKLGYADFNKPSGIDIYPIDFESKEKVIGILAYISVLERKKEIGILRSIGASKGDISRVFNAETIIVGFTAGVIGIGLTMLACIPANAIVYSLFDVANVASLPWQAAVILVAISVFLTFLAGLIPSSAASRKDPVEALRSE